MERNYFETNIKSLHKELNGTFKEAKEEYESQYAEAKDLLRQRYQKFRSDMNSLYQMFLAHYPANHLSLKIVNSGLLIDADTAYYEILFKKGPEKNALMVFDVRGEDSKKFLFVLKENLDEYEKHSLECVEDIILQYSTSVFGKMRSQFRESLEKKYADEISKVIYKTKRIKRLMESQ